MTAKDGTTIQLEQLGEYTYKWKALKSVNVHEEADVNSVRADVIIRGKVLEAEAGSKDVHGETWIQIIKPKGWARVGTELDGESLELVDAMDRVRELLRELGLEALRRQAAGAGVNPLDMDASSPSACVESKHETVELIIEQYMASGRNLELYELTDGWDGVESGPLDPGDRVEVHVDIDRLVEGEEDLKHFNRMRGNVVRKTGSGGPAEYEVRLDGQRQTAAIARKHLKKATLDETKSQTLFGALLDNDMEQLRFLIDKAEEPPDALNRNREKVEAGMARVLDVRDEHNHSLMQVALAKQAQCPATLELLRGRLMVNAVSQDNLIDLQEQLNAGGALSTLDAEGTPMIELARLRWQAEGAAQTAARAADLGGRCWFELSVRWKAAYGFAYDPAQHADGKSLAGLSAVMTTAQMADKFKVQETETMASVDDLQDAMQWKERNAFMTRKTTMA